VLIAGLRLIADHAAAVAAPAGGLRARPLGPADRWGRSALGVTVGGSDLALSLLRDGGAVVEPLHAPPNCLNSYLEAESAARLASRGAWWALLPVNGADKAAMAAQAGRWTIVEGRIVSVGVTRRSAFLNLSRRGEGSSVVLGLAHWRALEAKGWTAARLRGQTIRARGVVDGVTPPRLLLGTLAGLEVLE
jgi:hypothetical protein